MLRTISVVLTYIFHTSVNIVAFRNILNERLTFTSSLKTALCIIRLLLRPPAMSSKSITWRTFSRNFFTNLIFTSASSNAAHISFSIEFKTWKKVYLLIKMHSKDTTTDNSENKL